MSSPALLGLLCALAPSFSSACRRDRGQPAKQVDEEQKVVLGDVRVGKEATQLYIVYRFDSALLGFAVSTDGGPQRYFPLFASTYRGIPAVTLEVLASKTEDEIWIRSSWPGNEILAYHRVGASTAMTPWGELTFMPQPMPDHLSGGPSPLPVPNMQTVVKKAAFRHGDPAK